MTLEIIRHADKDNYNVEAVVNGTRFTGKAERSPIAAFRSFFNVNTNGTVLDAFVCELYAESQGACNK